MIYLVNWLDDWFVARVFQNDKTLVRCWIQAADDPKFEAMGFGRGGGGYPADCHYYKSFEEDPGFKYYSKLEYKGMPVGLNSIRPDAFPREAYVHTYGFGPPPEEEEWKFTPRDGYDRYIPIDDLEKVEIPPPDWSLEK